MSNKTHNDAVTNRAQNKGVVANTARPHLQAFTAKPQAGRLLTETIQPTGAVVVTANVQVPKLISGVKAQASSQANTGKSTK